jgi:hypothetical protein
VDHGKSRLSSPRHSGNKGPTRGRRNLPHAFAFQRYGQLDVPPPIVDFRRRRSFKQQETYNGLFRTGSDSNRTCSAHRGPERNRRRGHSRRCAPGNDVLSVLDDHVPNGIRQGRRAFIAHDET